MTTALVTGFSLAFVASLFWVFLDITRKWLGIGISATGAVAGLAVFQLPFLGLLFVLGWWFPASDASSVQGLLLTPPPAPSTSFFTWWGLAVPVHVISNLLFLRAVQVSPFSLTIPYLSFTPVFSALLGVFMLREVPSGWGWAGIAVVCLGAFFLNPGRSSDGILAPLKALWTERGSFYMLLVSMMWSLTPILDKKAAAQGTLSFYLLLLNAGITLAFVGIRWLQERQLQSLFQEWHQARGLLWLSGGVAMVAMVTQMASFSFIPVSYLETIKRGVGLLGAVAAGAWLFKEAKISQRLVSVVVMMVGIALILLAP